MSRQVALDVARGLAVVGMVFLHPVPVQGRALTRREGKAAALFCVLGGIVWARPSALWSYTLRRALVLAVVGVLLHRFVWSTEVLVPLALMMVLTKALRRVALPVAALLVLATPLLLTRFAGVVAADWLDDGGHAADHALGWVTVRFLLLDGNYPLIPWLAFPLLHPLFATPPKPRFWAALVLGTLVHLGMMTGVLTSTWVPTSMPFVLQVGSTAVALVSGLQWVELKLPRLLLAFATLGRTSLTHYLLHLLAVIVPLRLRYPDEGWPRSVGLWAFALYFLVALPLTHLWLRRFPRGPIEALLLPPSPR